MTELSDDLLQRYYDGELSPVEEQSVRARVESDPAAEGRLKELAQLSEMIQQAADQMAGDLDQDSMFAGITAGVAQEKAAGSPGTFEVITNEWSEHKRSVWVPVIAAGAIAAAALLTVLAPGTPGGDTVAEGTTAPDPEDAPSAPEEQVAPEEGMKVAVADAAMPSQGSEIENVDFGANAGTVFEIETKGMTTAVVWIADEEEEGEL